MRFRRFLSSSSSIFVRSLGLVTAVGVGACSDDLGDGGVAAAGGAVGEQNGVGGGASPSVGGSAALGSGGAGAGGVPGVGGQANAGSCIPTLVGGEQCKQAVDSSPCVSESQECLCGSDARWACSLLGGGAGGAPGVGGSSGVGGEGTVDGGGGMDTGAGGTEAGYDYAASVENTGTACSIADLADPGALPEITKLPDPFTNLAGERLSAKSEWQCRRQEIHKQAEKYIYGEKPLKPDVVTGSVTESQISVHVEAEGKSIEFTADVVLPSTGSAPYPAIINVGGKGGFGGISLGESRILDEGIAIIYYNHNELGQEGAAEASRGLDNPGLFYDIYGGDHSAGLLMAWAWGASRMIDVIQEFGGDVIDVGALGVTGCSRNGKGAFTVGVFDERIALTIPHETSTGGVPLYRMVDILNTERTDHNYFGLNWLSNDFEPFVYQNGTSNAVKLPIDSHEMVAMIAPRGLLVLENPHETQMSAPAGHAATMAGLEVYKALGVEGNVSYHSSVSNTGHCAYKDEYTDLLIQNITRFLKHENEDPGEIVVGQGGDGDPQGWITWDTPELAD